jgi:putative oxidoreductase
MSAHAADVGLLILRVVTGLIWCGHGTQKLFGWFGAKRRGTLEAEFAHFGYYPPLLFGRLAGTCEVVGGLLLATGFATPVGAGLLICVAVQATAVWWPNGVWMQDNGYEYLLILGAISVMFAFVGAGQLSLDAAFGTNFAGAVAGIVVIAVGAVQPFLPRTLGSAAPAAHGSEPTDG